MEIVRHLVAPVSADVLFVHVDDLTAYEPWMPLIHDVEVADGGEPGTAQYTPAWTVELRAQVGPFARSKRLRMERIELVPHELVVFERNENDGRQHSPWTLRAALDATSADETTLTMTLRYGGSLWGGAVLGRVLDDQVRRGSEALLELVTSGD